MAPSVSGVQRKIAALAAVAAIVGAVSGRLGVWGVLLGASMVVSSLWIYALLVGTVVRAGRPHLALGLTFGKLAAFLTLGWWAMSQGAGAIDPLGVAVGITCLPAAALWEALRTRKS